MTKNRDYLHKNVSFMLNILIFATLLVFTFSFDKLEDLYYSFGITAIFFAISSITAYVYFKKGKLEQFEEIVLISFESIVEDIMNFSKGKAISEIEFNENGANLRVFLLNADDQDIKMVHGFIINLLMMNDEYYLYGSINVISLKNIREIEEKRKLARIFLEQKINEDKVKVTKQEMHDKIDGLDDKTKW